MDKKITNNKNKIIVSVIIPCRNEEQFIPECLDSVIQQDYPQDKMEILVVDGMSNDKTRKIIKKYSSKYSFIRLLDNPKKIIPSAMNVGILSAQGEIIMKVDAHSTYPKNYISTCLKYLFKYQAENVGGTWNILPRENTIIAKIIAHSLTHVFASGNALIKIGSKKPQLADAVAFGCFKKEIFNKIGLFDEKIIRGSDMDLNKRLKKVGGKILLIPNISINYYADSNLKTFWKHNFSDGLWITYALKFNSKAFSWRHLIPLAFVLSLIGTIILSVIFPLFKWLFWGIAGIYVIMNLIASLHITIKYRNALYLLIVPFVFVVRHFGYGIGALWGLIKLLKSDK